LTALALAKFGVIGFGTIFVKSSSVRPQLSQRSAVKKEKEMQSIRKDLEEFQGQLKDGTIVRSYRSLISYMMGLQSHFKKKYTNSSVSALYQGYMDMTYFAISTPLLKEHDLKCAIVFNYESFFFEAWLAGRNRSVNRQYWELLKDQKLSKYRIVTPAKGIDSIVECDLVKDFNLNEADVLTESIEVGTEAFIEDIEGVLKKVQAK
jgi:hypothetical protein